jgi:hypothetical protein
MRRAVVTAAAIASACAIACGGPGGAKSPASPSPSLHVAPAVDLAQAAGLAWIVDVWPRTLAAEGGRDALALAFPDDERRALAKRNGGIDPLDLHELVVAQYADATLYLARGAFDPAAVETWFKTRATDVDGRAVDRDPTSGAEVTRTWATIDGEREQLALFGPGAVALEVGHFGPLRVAELFAEGRLKRAKPALQAGPLARAAEIFREDTAAHDDPPARAFALGPFEGDAAKPLGGLLAASTAVAAAARPTTVNGEPALALTLLLIGAWYEHGAEAASRLRAGVNRIAATPLGRLGGLDRPLAPVVVDALPDALRLRVTIGALALARGYRAATQAEVREMMSY